MPEAVSFPDLITGALMVIAYYSKLTTFVLSGPQAAKVCQGPLSVLTQVVPNLVTSAAH